MKLFIFDREVQDAVIPIRWCLNRKELRELKERKAKNPHLLLVTVHGNEEVDRYIIPLNQMLAYIQFHKPGKNRILATVVWHEQGKAYKLKDHYLSRSWSGDTYSSSVLRYNRESFRSDLCYDYYEQRLGQQAEITVMVPAELFAKEPPAWEKWWVNLWFETRPRDQCQFRRRRMIAYTIQPPLVSLFVIVISIFRILAVIALLSIGKRGVNLKPIIHPFQHSSQRVWRNAGLSVFLKDAKQKRRHWLIILFMPLIFLGFLVLFISTRLIFPSSFSDLTLQWWHYPLTALVCWLGIVVIICASFALYLAFYFPLRFVLKILKVSILESLSEKRQKRKEAKNEEKERRRLEEEKEENMRLEQAHVELKELLACNGEFRPELSALPKEKQTIYLKYQDLKAKVCKPFAR